MFVETDSKYHSGFEVVEYKGKWSLIRAKQGTDKVWQVWGDIEIGKDKKKRLPVAVELGDRQEAIEALERVLDWLKGEEEMPF